MEAPAASQNRLLASGLAAILFFAVAAKGAHDLWAATTVYIGVLALFCGFIILRGWPEPPLGFSKAFIPPAMAVAASFSLSFWGSVNPGESFLALLDWISAILFFYVSLHALRSEGDLEFLLACLVPLFWLEAAVNLYWLCTINKYWLQETPGTLVNAILSAGFNIVWIPVFIDKVIAESGRGRVPWYWLSAAAANILSFILAESLWGWLCLALALPLWLSPDIPTLLERVRRRPRLAASLIASACVIVGLALHWKFTHLYDMDGNPLPAGKNIFRLLWWASGLRMFLDHPWLGVGLGNFPSAYLAYKVGSGQHTLSAHSFVVKLIAETGSLGCLSAVFFLASWLRRIARRGQEAGGRRPLLLGLLLFLLFISINLGSEYLAGLLLLALFAGAAAAPSAELDSRPRRVLILALAAACVSATPYIASPLMASRLWVGGEEQLRLGRVDAALSSFSSAADIDPLSFEARRSVAKALFVRFLSARRTRDLDEAILQQRKAVALNGLDGRLWGELGRYYAAAEKLSEAVGCYEKALSLRPVNARHLESELGRIKSPTGENPRSPTRGRSRRAGPSPPGR